MKPFFLLLSLLLLPAASNVASAQITPGREVREAVKEDPNAKYLVSLPEENGKVYLLREVQLPEGADTSEVFEKMTAWLDRCMQDKNILRHTQIPGKEPQTLQQLVTHKITFSSNIIALDQTEMDYVITLSLQGNTMRLKMSHISFLYNGEDRDRKMVRYSGESHIADEVALNKKHTKLIYGYRKFRVKTIDLMDEYESSLRQAFWIK